ncbi:MAG: zf-HC2 domain-containing protein [Candidatus Eremiobacteraeota bacterium]|nr:zf-HC2 domain-containing protein [Candidatus Eremiobacteraeota bacterium]
MNCEDFEKMCVLHSYNELDARDQAILERHMAGCPRCRQYMDDMGAIRKGLKNLTLPQPPELDLAALKRRADSAAPEKLSLWDILTLPKARYLVPACALFVAAIAIAFVLTVSLHNGGTGGSLADCSWTTGDENSIEAIQSETEALRAGRQDLYELHETVQRRCDSDTGHELRMLGSYESQIADIRIRINEF